MFMCPLSRSCGRLSISLLSCGKQTKAEDNGYYGLPFLFFVQFTLKSLATIKFYAYLCRKIGNMGKYINLGNNSFASALNGLYIDKSGLIGVINRTLHSERRFCCVTRSRRFGKSLAAKMLAAYYDCSCDSRELFANLEIAKDSTFEQHINKYNVIYLDMTSFVTRFHDDDIIANAI